jgi:uncharacterized damage-inducible protein DinB
MTIAEAFLSEFENEARTTRKFLERLPADKLTWKPHEKSMSAGELALHIAATPAGVLEMALKDEAAPPNFGGPRPQPTSVEEVLRVLEASIATVRQRLPTIDDRRMQSEFKVTKDGTVLMAMPRAAFLRNILLNHWYHHRGQFGVYLRVLGAKVPSSYGPSGDELPEFLQGKVPA